MIEGDIASYVRALGAREGDPRFAEAVARAADDYEVSTYNDRGFEEKYFVGETRGTDFLLKGGELSSVFFYADGSADRSAYTDWATLIDGVGPASTRDEIVNVLGEPLRSTEFAVVYEVDGGYVRFAFESGVLTMAVAQRDIPRRSAAAPAPEATTDAASAPPASASEPEAVAPDIEGDLTAFIEALGTEVHSPEHLRLIVLAGPAMEVETDEQGGAAWEYHRFPSSGVVLQFKDGVLVGALVRLVADEDDPAYPWIDRLVTGFTLPATRKEINAHFGSSRYASEDMDLYLVAERYVQFNYESDQSIDVTVILPGAEA